MILTTEQQERVKALAKKFAYIYDSHHGAIHISEDAMIELAAALLSEFSAQKVQEPYAGQQWKSGNEYLPYHPSASHVSPAYREGWNACYQAAPSSLRVNPVTVAWLNDADPDAATAFKWAKKNITYAIPNMKPLGVIMEADKADELMVLHAENAAYDLAAVVFYDQMGGLLSAMRHLPDVGHAILQLKKQNDARIAQIEEKT